LTTTNKQKSNWRELERLLPTIRQTEIIVGSMLGDGSLFKPAKPTHNSYFNENHCLEQSDYVDFKAAELGAFTNKVTNYKKPSGQYGFKDGRTRQEYNDRSVRHMATKRHPFFTGLEKAWYKRDEKGNYVLNAKKERIKIIPQDIILTPLTVAIWYLDDGWHNPVNRTANICTDGFSIEEVDFLCQKIFVDFGIKCNRQFHQGKPQIHINSYSYKFFIDMIAPFVIVDCMKYKIDTSSYKPSTHINQNDAENIINLWNEGFNYSQISESLKISYEIVGVVLRKHNKVGIRAGNKSGYVGVGWVQRIKRWQAYIYHNKKHINLGYYISKEQAVEARLTAEKSITNLR
jgi:hypothetical protein